MAGTDPRFPTAQFNEAIKFAMRMGSPTRPEDRAIFHFKRKRIYPEGTRLDQSGKPLNSAIRAEYVQPEPLTLEEVAVEFDEAPPDELPVGVRIPTRVTITLLEEQYQQIKDHAATIVLEEATEDDPAVILETGEEFAHEVELGGDRYHISYRPPPMALFDAGVHQLVCHAFEES